MALYAKEIGMVLPSTIFVFAHTTATIVVAEHYQLWAYNIWSTRLHALKFEEMG